MSLEDLKPKESTATDSNDQMKKYHPERDYAGRGYKSFGKPFDDLCGNCDRYYKNVHDLGLTNFAFPPECKGHILAQFDDLEEDDFDSEEEYAELLVNSDPVSWASYYFGWDARWYQTEIMNCTAQRKVVRAGRRIGKTLSVSVLGLWMLLTNKNFSILIIAPFERQVAKIFEEMNKFLDMRPEFKMAIKRNTRSPCRLEFNNGSTAMGFSSGNNAAAGSDKIRGQDANYIIIDEADYINNYDIEAILAILASHPTCGLWASSTPRGTHDKFYQWATIKDLGFKEFWYNSNESPNWNEKTEAFFRSNFDAVTYDHEFNAEFGLQESGVFRIDLVDRAILNYELPRARTPDSKIIIGVDWNGQSIGTHIVVTEAVSFRGAVKYVLLEKTVIKGELFTAHAAIKEILNLDEKYKSDFIYVDAGYGEVQVEMLHKIGLEFPESGLKHKVKAYTMQSSIELKDPYSSLMVKKPAKQFMINMAVMQLEQNRIVLPHSEDTQVFVDSVDTQEASTEVGLVQQLRNFSIEAVSSTGLIRYSQGEDHTITAWMLCLVGFVIEMSDIVSPQQTRNDIVFPEHVGPIGSKTGTEIELESNRRVSEVARGIDLGIKKPNTTVQQISTARSNAKRDIARGDRKSISHHYGSSSINRTPGLGSGRGRGGRGRGGRSTF